MRLFRNTMSLMCALALLLSLAPAAFAEDTGDETEVTYEKIVDETNGSYSAPSATVDAGKEIHVDNSASDNGLPGAPATNATILGKLTNDGKVDVRAERKEDGAPKSAELFVESLENQENGIITVHGEGGTGESGTLSTVLNADSLQNEGSITVEDTESGSAKLEYDSITNEKDITVSAKDGGAVLDGNTVENRGTITVESESNEVHLRYNTFNNYGKLEAEGTSVTLSSAGKMNNYGTVTITEGNEKITSYYGVNYVDKDGNLASLLKTWKDGESGKSFTKTLEDNVGTKEGYNFGGWKVTGDDTIYQANDTVSFTIGDKVMSITEIWNAILNNTPIVSSGDSGEHVEKAEKSGEKIVKYIDAKVLDADRRELEPDTEYYKVAKTSYNRLIVTFTWQQMAELEEGEHLYYIVTPDGVETEYTLTIW